MAKRVARWTKGLAVAAAVLAMGAGAGGAEVVEGLGVVRGKDLAARTLELRLETYEVGRATQLQGLHGEELRLEEVPVEGDPVGTQGQREPGAVEFRAVKRGDRWQLLRLRLIPRIPR